MGAASSRNKGKNSLTELDETPDHDEVLKEQRDLVLSNASKVGLAVVDLDKIDLTQEYACLLPHIVFMWKPERPKIELPVFPSLVCPLLLQ